MIRPNEKSHIITKKKKKRKEKGIRKIQDLLIKYLLVQHQRLPTVGAHMYF